MIEQQSVFEDEASLPEAKKKLVKQWISRVKGAKDHYEKDFKRMKEDMELARSGSSDKDWSKKKKYTANIVQRHVKQTTAALYAKNPTAIAKRRRRLEFALWDGQQSSLQQAFMALDMAQQTMTPPPPQAQALIQDFMQGTQMRQQLDRIARTLEVLFAYFQDEQDPDFKTQMKQSVRRAITTGVAYCKIGFQRDMERRPDVEGRIADIQTRLAYIERLTRDAANDKFDVEDAEAEELRVALEALMNEEMLVTREGLVFDFPSSTKIIPDPATKVLKGWVGTRWIAHEYDMTADAISETWAVDVCGTSEGEGGATTYNKDGQERGKASAYKSSGDGEEEADYYRVWEIQDKLSGTVCVVCDGWFDFLEDPHEPDIKLERFFNVYVLSFNDLEHESRVFPISDVSLLRDMQDEYNRSRQGLREHRQAARPKYVTPQGALEEEDKKLLARAPAHHVFEARGLMQGEKVADKIQAVPSVGVDPNLYVTNHLLDDVQITAGAQEANFGMVSKGTATETQVAEGARMSTSQSSVDDLDDWFTEICRGCGQILLGEMSQEQVYEIVGPGAFWPEFTSEDIQKELYLDIEAGSSGRPNKSVEIQNFERMAPYLVQMPGISPEWLAKQALKRLDDGLDLTEAVSQGVPSIVAQNQLARGGGGQPGTGDPSTDPASQGGQGGNNAPNPRERQPGPQGAGGANNLG